MFNMSLEEVKRQCDAGTLHCDHNEPIRRGETLEPCVRGAKKINNDPELSKIVRGLLTGREEE